MKDGRKTEALDGPELSNTAPRTARPARRRLLQGMSLVALSGVASGQAAAAQAPGAVDSDGNSAASALGAAGRSLSSAATGADGSYQPYPPLRTGLRGSHPGAFEPAHALRDGQQPGPAADTGEHYDLIVVGGGISGLAAAFFYRQRQPSARVLILENHDDFGGHAKRNEFMLDGELHVMNGGTDSIESPRPYSAVAEQLLRDIGIDTKQLSTRVEKPDFYPKHGLSDAVFFDKANFGTDRLIRHPKGVPLRKALARAPLSVQARKDIVSLEEGAIDYLPGLTSDEKKQRLSTLSYQGYLQDIARVDPDVIRFYQQRTHGWFGLGIDAVSALDCWAFNFPGFKGLALEPGSIPRMGPSAQGFAETGGSIDVHLPDGGASVARSLVRGLIPAAIPGSGIDDLVTARVDYAALDQADNAVRIRLSAIALKVQNVPADKGGGVTIEYVKEGSLRAVSAKQTVMACWSCVIPHLCPELPEEQKLAMHSLVKTPLVYASVAVRNWNAFQKLGVARIHAPAAYFSSVSLNESVAIGKYSTPARPNRPVLVHLVRTPCLPGSGVREQFRSGRAELLATSLETFEMHIRSQLDAMLGAGGFDSSRDILAITVNRWPHGYAYEYDPVGGPPDAPGKAPNIVARQRFGAIAIANSDVGGLAYMDSAIDQAHRAVSELLSAPA